MIVKDIDFSDIPSKGRSSGKFGERKELIKTIIDQFMNKLNASSGRKVIEIIDDEGVFNNNNDLRRMYQSYIEANHLDNKISITMRRGRVFLMDAKTYKDLTNEEISIDNKEKFSTYSVFA